MGIQAEALGGLADAGSDGGGARLHAHRVEVEALCQTWPDGLRIVVLSGAKNISISHQLRRW